MTPVELLAQLHTWSERGWLGRLDIAMARWVHELDPQASPEVLMVVAALVQMESRGHSCLALSTLVTDPQEVLALPMQGRLAIQALWAQLPTEPSQWSDALARCVAVYRPNPVGTDERQPLVLAGTAESPLVYLRRYWVDENRVVDQIVARLRPEFNLPFDLAAARYWLSQLFDQGVPNQDVNAPGFHWQKLACAMALTGRLTVVTGGPGTGKTYTAARILALLAAMDPAQRATKIVLAAPTGKAATRLKQSIDATLLAMQPKLKGVLDLAPLLQRLGPARTLHSVLGARPDSRQWRFHAGHLLDVDILVVDEASMVHLGMMAALLSALPLHAKVILLGDKDQLASVEAGAILGDLCHRADLGRYDQAVFQLAEQVVGQALPNEFVLPQGLPVAQKVPALAQHTVMLRDSRRFKGVIGELALAVNAGDVATAQRLLSQSGAVPAVAWLSQTDVSASAQGRLLDQVVDWAVNGRTGVAGSYHTYLKLVHDAPETADAAAHAQWVRGILVAFDSFRVLCAVREGDWGTQGLNRQIAKGLQRAGWLRAQGPWYAGRPVMVTRNDASLGLFNGDIGVVLPSFGHPALLKAYFFDGDHVRGVSVGRLADVETAFALTVHKSQGSEYLHTLLVLPAHAGPLLSRELVYTGITRAKEAFTLVTQHPDVLATALTQPTRRVSGLLPLLERST